VQRNIFILRFLIVLVCIPIIGFLMGARVEAQPTVQVEVNVPPPPAVQVEVQAPAEEYIPEGDPTPPPPLAIREPELVVVPSGNAQVYMVPSMVGVYFYGGSWYRFHHGVWFRAAFYNDPWVLVAPAIVPRFVVGIPPAYPLYLPPAYHRIHYRDFHSHWRTWDRERYWHRYDWYRNERRADIRRERERQAHARMERDRQIRVERIKERERRPQRVEHKGPGPQGTGEVKRQHPVPVGPQRTGEVHKQPLKPVGPERVGRVHRQPGEVGPQRTGKLQRQPAEVKPQKTVKVQRQAGPVQKQPGQLHQEKSHKMDNQQNLK
jgi:hypothetical protein